jgi:hypothetical protein
MRRIDPYNLWIGNAGDLRDFRSILNAEISAVIALADNEPAAVLPRELVQMRFPLNDGGENPEWLLKLAIESTAACLRAGVPVLVCCSAGMSRSVCVAAAAIALVEHRPILETLPAVVGNAPADVSPQFFAQIRAILDSSTAAK